MFRPDFIENDEDWVIWLLGGEFPGHATPEQIIERTHFTSGQLDEAIRNLERIKALRVIRIPGRFPPDNIEKVALQKYGDSMFEELKLRSTSE